jgi:four helix bundle protein
MAKKIGSFEDLDVWKESMRLTVDVYQKLKNCKDYGFKDQIQRSAVSIPSNIAEGFERKSNKEFIQFLHISKSSCGELRTQLYLVNELKYVNESLSIASIEKTRKISAMLYKLIKTRNEKFN